MPIIIQTRSGKSITIEDVPLGKGGEGEIYSIISPLYKGHCVKLYFDKYRTQDRQKKIEFMIKNPPADLSGTNYIVCWPVEIIFQHNQFVGFIMPAAFSDSEDLYELCVPKSTKLSQVWQQKYDRKTKDGLIARMKLCTNLAASIYRVHSLNQYVFVDMKPQNILVTNDSKISLVDLDSIQITQNNKLLFPAEVSTPEYTPPESKNNFAIVGESWDRFSMAVIFYEILFNIHPYVASFSGKYQSCNTIPEYIQNNLFVHGSNKKYVAILPSPHKNYQIIPSGLQTLFIRAFETNAMQQRPSARDFGETFFKIVEGATKANKTATNNTKSVNTPAANAPAINITTAPSGNIISSSIQNANVSKKYASIEDRIKAHITDMFISLIFSALFVSFVGFFISPLNQIDNSIKPVVYVLSFIISLYIYWVYPLTISWQATIGKKLTGIKVVNKEGIKTSLSKLIIRQLILLLMTLLLAVFFPLYLIFIGGTNSYYNSMIQFLSRFFMSKENQALHDLIAQTIVIEDNH